MFDGTEGASGANRPIPAASSTPVSTPQVSKKEVDFLKENFLGRNVSRIEAPSKGLIKTIASYIDRFFAFLHELFNKNRIIAENIKSRISFISKEIATNDGTVAKVKFTAIDRGLIHTEIQQMKKAAENLGKIGYNSIEVEALSTALNKLERVNLKGKRLADDIGIADKTNEIVKFRNEIDDHIKNFILKYPPNQRRDIYGQIHRMLPKMIGASAEDILANYHPTNVIEDAVKEFWKEVLELFNKDDADKVSTVPDNLEPVAENFVNEDDNLTPEEVQTIRDKAGLTLTPEKVRDLTPKPVKIPELVPGVKHVKLSEAQPVEDMEKSYATLIDKRGRKFIQEKGYQLDLDPILEKIKAMIPESDVREYITDDERDFYRDDYRQSLTKEITNDPIKKAANEFWIQELSDDSLAHLDEDED